MSMPIPDADQIEQAAHLMAQHAARSLNEYERIRDKIAPILQECIDTWADDLNLPEHDEPKW